MGSRVVLALILLAGLGVLAYVATSGGDGTVVDEDLRPPEAPPEEAVVPPPVVTVDADPDASDPAAPGMAALVVTVLDAEKQPVAGALVRVATGPVFALVRRDLRLAPPRPEPAAEIDAREGRTAADGRVRFEGLRAKGILHVTAEGPGEDLYPATLPVKLARNEEKAIVLTVRPGGSVRGAVQGPDGTALPVPFAITLGPVRADGALLGNLFSDNSAGARPREFPGGNGAFEIRGVKPGRYEAFARADGYVDARSEPIVVKAGEVTEGVEITLKTGGSIAGVVTDKGTGDPLPGVEISLVPKSQREFLAIGGFRMGTVRAKTDEAGRFRIPGVEAGNWSVLGRKKGYADGRMDDVVAHAGMDTRELRIALGPCGTITGTVYGPDGKPKAGETVLIQAASARGGVIQIVGDHGTRVTSDERGVYVATHVQPGRYRVKQPRASRRDGGRGAFAYSALAIARTAKDDEPEPLAPDMVEVSEGETVVKDIRMELRATIRGTVVDRDGKPVTGQAVSLRRRKPKTATPGNEPSGNRRPDFVMPQTRRPDKRGVFTYTGIEAGRYVVSCGDAREEIEVTAGETVEVNLVFTPGRVEGIVVDDAGRPVAGARIVLRRVRDTSTDLTQELGSSPFTSGRRASRSDGRFVVEPVVAGRYTVRATHASGDGTSEEFDLPAGGLRTDVRVVLVPRVAVTVTVLDKDGNPVPDAWIYAGSKSAAGKSGRTNSKGTAKLMVAPGRFSLMAGMSDSPGVSAEPVLITVRPREPQSVEIHLK